MHSFSAVQDIIFKLTDNPESLIKNISDNFISKNKHVDNLESNIYGAFYPDTCTFELNTNPTKIFLKENNHILFHIEHEQESPENSIWDMKTAPCSHINARIDNYLMDIVDKVGEAMDKFRSKDLHPVASDSYYSRSIGSILRPPQAKQPITTPANFSQTPEKENNLENKASAVREAVDRFNSKPLNPVAPTSYYSKSIGSIRRTPHSRQLFPATTNLAPTTENGNSLENKVNVLGEVVDRLNPKPLSPVAPTSYYSKSIGSILRAPQARPPARPPVPTPPNFPKTAEKENRLENKVNAVGEDVKRLNSTRPLNPVEPTSYYATSLLPDMPRAPRATQPVATTTANFPRTEEKESSLAPKFEVCDEDRLYDNSPAVALPQATSEREDTILKRLEALEKATKTFALRETISNKRIGALEAALKESIARVEALESQLKDRQEAQKSEFRLFK